MNESNFYAQNPSFSVGLPLSICLINYFDLHFIQNLYIYVPAYKNVHRNVQLQFFSAPN